MLCSANVNEDLVNQTQGTLVWKSGTIAGFCFRFYFDSQSSSASQRLNFEYITGRNFISYLKSTKPETRNYIIPQRHIRAYRDTLESSKNCPSALLFNQTEGGYFCAHLLNDQGKIRSWGCYMFERLFNHVYNLCNSPLKQPSTSFSLIFRQVSAVHIVDCSFVETLKLNLQRGL